MSEKAIPLLAYAYEVLAVQWVYVMSVTKALIVPINIYTPSVEEMVMYYGLSWHLVTHYHKAGSKHECSNVLSDSPY